jgi:hypothetical protein
MSAARLVQRGREEMTMAEIDGCYLPGHARRARAPRIPAQRGFATAVPRACRPGRRAATRAGVEGLKQLRVVAIHRESAAGGALICCSRPLEEVALDL